MAGSTTLRLLHLVGSAESDFYADLSRLYATDCLDSLGPEYDSVIAWVAPDRTWRFPLALTPDAIAAAEPVDVATALARIATAGIDVAVPQMFCLPGMTYYRGLFDLLDIPYVGNTPDVMALGANKARARAVVAAGGVHVPRGEVLRRGDRPSLRTPSVVKPVAADNSLGISLVRTPDEYGKALQAAFRHGDEVLIEEYVELGREVRCGVLVRDGELVCLPLEEYDVDPDRKPIRDHADKIGRDPAGDLGLMAKDGVRAWMVDPADPVTAPVWDAATKAHLALGCRHYSLFDFRVDPDGVPWFLEAGLYCSFARQSVVSMMAAAAGIDLPGLFRTAVAGALHGRGRQRRG